MNMRSDIYNIGVPTARSKNEKKALTIICTYHKVPWRNRLELKQDYQPN